jgi:hypothetical protein
MDIKVEEVIDVKEEQEDYLAITCPALDIEQEVSCVSVHCYIHFLDNEICLTVCLCVLTANACLLVNGISKAL